jgi:hypothetical protein
LIGCVKKLHKLLVFRGCSSIEKLVYNYVTPERIPKPVRSNRSAVGNFPAVATFKPIYSDGNFTLREIAVKPEDDSGGIELQQVRAQLLIDGEILRTCGSLVWGSAEYETD